jgi:hypothetical protein
MNKNAMRAAQKYLTYYKNDIRKRIVDIRRLSKDHTTQEIIAFLKEYLREKERGLKNMLLIDRTNRRVDEMIAAIFRLYMAVNTLEEERDILQFSKESERRKILIIKPRKEVSGIDGIEQGAGTGGQLYKRDSSRDCGPGQRENEDHDGANWYPGHETRRAA